MIDASQTDNNTKEQSNSNALIPLVLITLVVSGIFAFIGLATAPQDQPITDNIIAAPNDNNQATAAASNVQIKNRYDDIVQKLLSNTKANANKYKKYRSIFTKTMLPSSIYGSTDIKIESIKIQKQIRELRSIINVIMEEFDNANSEAVTLLSSSNTPQLNVEWNTLYNSQRATYEAFFEIENQIIIAQFNLLNLYIENFDQLALEPVKRSFIFQNKTSQKYYIELKNLIKELEKQHRK